MGNVGLTGRLHEHVAQLDALIDEIRNKSKPPIDGMVLSCAVYSIFQFGLKKNEISSFRVSQVSLEEDCIRFRKPAGERQRPIIWLSPKEKGILQSYLDYLDSHSEYCTSSTSPFFPGYQGKSGAKKITRHLEKFSDQMKCNQIHYLGIMETFNRFVGAKNARSIATTKTAKRFRLTERQVSDVTKGTIQPAGRTKRVIEEENEIHKLIGIYEKVDRLKDSSPEVFKEVEDILSEFYELSNNPQYIPKEQIHKCENMLMELIEDKDICLNARSGAIYVSFYPKPQAPQQQMTLLEAIKRFDVR